MSDDLLFTIAEELRRDLAPHFQKYVCSIPTKEISWHGIKAGAYAKKCVELRPWAYIEGIAEVRVLLLPACVFVTDELSHTQMRERFEWEDPCLFEKIRDAVARVLMRQRI